MEIEVGEYVRNEKGNIGQCIGIFDGHVKAKYHIQFQKGVKVKRQWLSTDTVKEHSKNIIDLIESGDLCVMEEDIVYMYNEGFINAVIEDIENGHKLISIVTREQLENNAFKVVD